MYQSNRPFALALKRVAILAGISALAGCASGPKSYEIKAVANPVINRDVSGRPLSVVVHVYQLKESGEFSKLTFDTLASGRPLAELLGKDLLEVSEVMLVPGSEESRSDKIHPEARHVGIVALFRQPDQHYWRVLVDADQVRSKGISFRVQDCFLSLVSPKASLIPGQPPTAPVSCPGNEVRPASVPAEPRTVAQGPQVKRGGALESARQAADSILNKKP